MAAPSTGFETDGTPTTLAHEETFLQTVAADTAAVYAVAGTSYEGRPMHRLDLGNANGTTWFIYTLVHANEPASREAILAFVRDLAYSTDPTITGYLAAHRIVLLTPMNPDGFAAGIRNTPRGDINKDHFAFETPEALVAQQTLRTVQPHLALDAHERFGTKAVDIEYFGTGTLAIDQALRDASNAACAAVASAVMTAGYTTAPYPSPGRVSGREAAAFHHCASILLETYEGDAMSFRISVYTDALMAVRAWHEANADTLADAKATSIANAQNNIPKPYILQTGDTAAGGDWPQVVLPTLLLGYETADAFPVAQMDAYGVVTDGNTIPMAQAARAVVPLLFDPDSVDAVGTSTQRIVLGHTERAGE